MSMEAAQKKNPAQIVRLDNAFKMVTQSFSFHVFLYYSYAYIYV